jgi:hypothetical protein
VGSAATMRGTTARGHRTDRKLFAKLTPDRACLARQMATYALMAASRSVSSTVAFGVQVGASAAPAALPDPIVGYV